ERAHLAGTDDVEVLAAPVRATRARKEAADMARDRAGGERVEQVMVRAVVSETEDEVRRLFAVREQAPYVDALVDAERAHLDDLVSGQDLRGRACEMLLQVVQELS